MKRKYYKLYDYEPNLTKEQIINEEYTIPKEAPYIIYLRHIPRENSVTIPGLTEIRKGRPKIGEFRVHYTSKGLGKVSFNKDQAGKSLKISYDACGTVLWAESKANILGMNELIKNNQELNKCSLAIFIADSITKDEIRINGNYQEDIQVGREVYLHSIDNTSTRFEDKNLRIKEVSYDQAKSQTVIYPLDSIDNPYIYAKKLFIKRDFYIDFEYEEDENLYISEEEIDYSNLLTSEQNYTCLIDDNQKIIINVDMIEIIGRDEEGHTKIRLNLDNFSKEELEDEIRITNINHNHLITTINSNYIDQYSTINSASNIALGKNSYAEGDLNKSLGDFSHTQGKNNKALGNYSHAQGIDNKVFGKASHVEGKKNRVFGDASHGEGKNTAVLGNYAHVEGLNTRVIGNYSHGEGYNTTIVGNYTHGEGYRNILNGNGSHIMGRFGKAIGNYSWFLGNGSSNWTRGLAAKILSNGNAYADGSWNTGGADYAEFFEWADGNTSGEDRVGYFVTLDENKTNMIRIANESDDYILGVVSATPSVIGDNQELHWKGRFSRDSWGRKIYEEVEEFIVRKDEKGNEIKETIKIKQAKVNPEWNSKTKYIPRKNRKEWSAIGLLGKIRVRDDGSSIPGQFSKVGATGIATKSSNKSGYKVLERLSEKQILILFN